MYRISVKSSGKYNNVVPGNRYCFTRKTAKELIKHFLDVDCDIAVEKLIRIRRDLFCFTDYDEGDKVFDYYDDLLDEMDR